MFLGSEVLLELNLNDKKKKASYSFNFHPYMNFQQRNTNLLWEKMSYHRSASRAILIIGNHIWCHTSYYLNCKIKILLKLIELSMGKKVI